MSFTFLILLAKVVWSHIFPDFTYEIFTFSAIIFKAIGKIYISDPNKSAVQNLVPEI